MVLGITMSATNQFMCVKLIVDFILNGLVVKITQVCGKTGIILIRTSTVFVKGTRKMCHSLLYLSHHSQPFQIYLQILLEVSSL